MDSSSVASEVPDLLEFLRPPVKKFSTNIDYGDDVCNYNIETDSTTSARFQNNRSTTYSHKVPVLAYEYSDYNIRESKYGDYNHEEGTDKNPLIKLIVLPKRESPLKVQHKIKAALKAHKSSQKQSLTSTSLFEASDYKNIFVLLAGPKRDKIYEVIPTDSSATLKKNNLEQTNQNDDSRGYLKDLLSSIKSEFLKNMNKKGPATRPCPKLVREEKVLREIQSASSTENSSDGGRGSRANVLTSPQKSRVRINGFLGRTQDDQYVLKCDATVNDQPIHSNFTEVRCFAPVMFGSDNQTSNTDVSCKNSCQYSFFSSNSDVACKKTKKRNSNTDVSYKKNSKWNSNTDVSYKMNKKGNSNTDVSYKKNKKGNSNTDVSCKKHNKWKLKRNYGAQTETGKLQGVKKGLFGSKNRLSRTTPFEDEFKRREPSDSIESIRRDQITQCPNYIKIDNCTCTEYRQDQLGSLGADNEKLSPVVVISVYPNDAEPKITKEIITNPRRVFDNKEYYDKRPKPLGHPQKLVNAITKITSTRNSDKPTRSRETSPNNSKSINKSKEINKVTIARCAGGKEGKLKSAKKSNTTAPKNSVVFNESKDTRRGMGQTIGVNTNIQQTKKAIIDSYTRSISEQRTPVRRDSMMNYFPIDVDNSESGRQSNVTVNIDGANEKYDMYLRQNDVATDFLIKKRKKDQSEMREMQRQGRERQQSPEPAGSFKSSTRLSQYRNTSPTRKSVQTSPPTSIFARDSLSAHQRRNQYTSPYETKKNNKKSPEREKKNVQSKHFRGDSCSVMDPLKRDKEIRELLGVENERNANRQSAKLLLEINDYPTIREDVLSTALDTVDRKKNRNCVLMKVGVPERDSNMSVRRERKKPIKLTHRDYFKVKRAIYIALIKSNHRKHSSKVLKTVSTLAIEDFKRKSVLNLDKNTQTELEHFEELVIRETNLESTPENASAIDITKADKYKDLDENTKKIIDEILKFKDTKTILIFDGQMKVLNEKKASPKESVKLEFKDSETPLLKTLKTSFSMPCDVNIGGSRITTKRIVQKKRSLRNPSKNRIISSSIEVCYSSTTYMRSKTSSNKMYPQTSSSHSRELKRVDRYVREDSIRTLYKKGPTKQVTKVKNSENIRQPIHKMKACDDVASVKEKRPFLRRLLSCLIIGKSKDADLKKSQSSPKMSHAKMSCSLCSYPADSSFAAMHMTTSAFDTSTSFHSRHSGQAKVNKTKKSFFSPMLSFLRTEK